MLGGEPGQRGVSYRLRLADLVVPVGEACVEVGDLGLEPVDSGETGVGLSPVVRSGDAPLVEFGPEVRAGRCGRRWRVGRRRASTGSWCRSSDRPACRRGAVGRSRPGCGSRCRLSEPGTHPASSAAVAPELGSGWMASISAGTRCARSNAARSRARSAGIRSSWASKGRGPGSMPSLVRPRTRPSRIS